MIQSAALLIIIAAGLWLGFVALLCALKPDRALHYLALMGSTWRINITELGIRALIGLAMVARAPASSAPSAFAGFGWFLAATAAIILAIPRERHAAFSRWSASVIPRSFVQWIVAPVALVGGALLILAAI
jgi:hypothetical protein